MIRCEIFQVDDSGELLFDTVSNPTLARMICAQRNRTDRNASPPRLWRWRKVGEQSQPITTIKTETQETLL